MKIKLKNMFYTIFLMSVISIVIWGAMRLIKLGEFYSETTSYITNASEASSPEVAIDSLDDAIAIIEEKGLDNGQISIFWESKTNNLELWYNNLKASREELMLAKEKDVYKRNIILDKQRKVLSKDAPMGITIYPYNKVFFWWSIISIFSIIGSLVLLDVFENVTINIPIPSKKQKNDVA